MEAEARAILAEACRSEDTPLSADALRDWVSELYDGRPPKSGASDLIAERRREARDE